MRENSKKKNETLTRVLRPQQQQVLEQVQSKVTVIYLKKKLMRFHWRVTQPTLRRKEREREKKKKKDGDRIGRGGVVQVLEQAHVARHVSLGRLICIPCRHGSGRRD